jgi:hypothetical protein
LDEGVGFFDRVISAAVERPGLGGKEQINDAYRRVAHSFVPIRHCLEEFGVNLFVTHSMISNLPPRSSQNTPKSQIRFLANSRFFLIRTSVRSNKEPGHIRLKIKQFVPYGEWPWLTCLFQIERTSRKSSIRRGGPSFIRRSE